MMTFNAFLVLKQCSKLKLLAKRTLHFSKICIQSSCLVFLLSFLSAVNFSAASSLPRAARHCLALLEDIGAILKGKAGFESPDDVYLDLASKDPSVKLIEVKQVDALGDVLTFERVSDDWLSQSRTTEYDPQGDPRWFMEAIGPEASQAFGFKLVGENQIEVPSVEAFQKAIDEVSTKLEGAGHQPLAVSYYPQASSRLADYLDNFIERGALPVSADRGNHFLHDMSFHSPYLFVPQKAHDYYREVLRYSMQTFDSAKENGEFPAAVAEQLKKNLMLELVERIDHVTASFGVAMNTHNRNVNSPTKYDSAPDEAFHTSFYLMGGAGNKYQAPQEYLQTVFEGAVAKTSENFQAIRPDEDQVKKYNQAIATAEENFRSWIQRDQTYSPAYFQGFTPQDRPVFAVEDLCKELTNIRLRAQSVAQQRDSRE